MSTADFTWEETAGSFDLILSEKTGLTILQSGTVTYFALVDDTIILVYGESNPLQLVVGPSTMTSPQFKLNNDGPT